MRTKPARPESERAAAKRLSDALQLNITRACVRHLKGKRIDLQDAEKVRYALGMAERKPKPIGSATKPKPAPQPKPASQPAPPADADQARPMSTAELDAKLAELQTNLLNAVDYEQARKIRVQISGIRDLFKTQVDRSFYVERSAMEREGGEIGLLVRALFMKIPAELPQMIIGLDYSDAVEKCEDYAFQALTEVYEMNSSQAISCEVLESDPLEKP